ncbi:MAG TPA: hypothetical protein VGG79_00005, partial [Roseiarcus sp.]
AFVDSQPDPTGEPPVTAASRSLATALSTARFASALLPPTYTIRWDTTSATARAGPPGSAPQAYD